MFAYQNDKTISAVSDEGSFSALLGKSHFSHAIYFNSGVLLINVKRWCEQNITAELIEILTNNNFRCPDQDAMNIRFKDDCNYLPIAYNECSIKKYKNIDSHDTDAIIVHYTGCRKPYFELFTTPLYREYLDKSPWKNDKLELALNTYAIGVYAKEEKKQKFKALCFYILYKFKKLKDKLNN